MGFDPYVLLFFWDTLQQHMWFIFLSSPSSKKIRWSEQLALLKKYQNTPPNNKKPKPNPKQNPENQNDKYQTKPKKTPHQPALHIPPHSLRGTLALGAAFNVAEALFQKALCVLHTRLAANKHTLLGKNLNCLFSWCQAEVREEHRCRARQTLFR